MNIENIKKIYFIAFLYDFILGVSIFFFGAQLLPFFGVGLPDHFAYLDFSSVLVAIFGLMFYQIYKDPIKNMNLIPFGIYLKITYVGLVIYYMIVDDIAMVWKVFAVFDLIFFILFYLSYRYINKK